MRISVLLSEAEIVQGDIAEAVKVKVTVPVLSEAEIVQGDIAEAVKVKVTVPVVISAALGV